MTMHHQHEGLHAQRDANGRKVIELKREATPDNLRDFIHKPMHNTNGESIVMNIPEGFAAKLADTNDSGVATAVNVVYVTVAPSFTGSILGFVTASANSDSQTTADIAPATAQVTGGLQNAAAFSSSTDSTTAAATPRVGPPVQVTKASTSSAATSINYANSVQNTAAASPQSSSSSDDNGLSGGAKAGLAIGIILAIALFAGLFFFCFRRKKNNNKQDEINEKSAYGQNRSSFFGTSAGKRASADSDRSFGTIHNTATAPRLSLRPVTQFFPVFGDKRKSGNLLASGGPQMSEKPSQWDRRQQGENPFTDSAAQHEKQTNPFEEDARSISPHGSEGAAPSPVAGAAAGAAAPGPRGPNNVHRVQLDFKPSMDDELELKSGQLVRMLHEYDDGWALCVRMDRSQQGVAPRTCLSKQPVKPRGPPPPGGRISPQGNSMRGPQPGPGVARKPVPGQAI